jgi:hypothetical protein
MHWPTTLKLNALAAYYIKITHRLRDEIITLKLSTSVAHLDRRVSRSRAESAIGVAYEVWKFGL